MTQKRPIGMFGLFLGSNDPFSYFPTILNTAYERILAIPAI